MRRRCRSSVQPCQVVPKVQAFHAISLCGHPCGTLWVSILDMTFTGKGPNDRQHRRGHGVKSAPPCTACPPHRYGFPFCRGRRPNVMRCSTRGRR